VYTLESDEMEFGKDCLLGQNGHYLRCRLHLHPNHAILTRAGIGHQ